MLHQLFWVWASAHLFLQASSEPTKEFVIERPDPPEPEQQLDTEFEPFPVTYRYPIRRIYSSRVQGYYQPQPAFVPGERILFDAQLNTWFRAIPDFTPVWNRPTYPYFQEPSFRPWNPRIFFWNTFHQPVRPLFPFLQVPVSTYQPFVDGNNIEHDGVSEVTGQDGSLDQQEDNQSIEAVIRDNDFDDAAPRQSFPESFLANSSLSVSARKFTKKLYLEILSSKPQHSNLVFSPYSLHSVLLMTMAGSSGKTWEEFQTLMDVDEEKEVLEDVPKVWNSLKRNEDFHFKMSNFVFIDKSMEVKQNYSQLVVAKFNSKPIRVDFRHPATLQKVNNYVKIATQGKISELLDKIDLETMMILSNTVYFKADWLTPFDKEITSDRDFHLLNGQTIQTLTMFTEAPFSLAEIPELNSRAVKLPYKGGRVSMVIILPNDKDGLLKLEKSLHDFDLSTISFGETSLVAISLPKFKLSTDLKLKENLRNLGVKTLFKEADLERMVIRNDLLVDSVVQKAIIEVSEESTEAAAASAAVFSTRTISFPEPFECDHPFMFYIEDIVTGLVLFIGRVVDPTSE